MIEGMLYDMNWGKEANMKIKKVLDRGKKIDAKYFEVGDLVRPTGNYLDEQIGEYAPMGPQIITKVKTSPWQAGQVLQTDKHHKWVHSNWFVPVKKLEDKTPKVISRLNKELDRIDRRIEADGDFRYLVARRDGIEFALKILEK